MPNRLVTAAMAAFGTAWLVLAFLVAVIEGCAFDVSYYEQEYRKNDTAAYAGVPQETLDEATAVLLDYLEGKRASLDFRVEAGGEEREYYNDREKAHMVDVRDLNEGAVRFMWVGFLLGGSLVAGAFGLSKERYITFGACFGALLGVLIGFAVLGIWAAADFSSFWTDFHHLFFSNDLWLFDPRDSLLIRMFEEQFFYDLVAKILAWFLSVTLGLLVVTGILWRRGRRKARTS